MIAKIPSFVFKIPLVNDAAFLTANDEEFDILSIGNRYKFLEEIIRTIVLLIQQSFIECFYVEGIVLFLEYSTVVNTV